MPPQSSGEISEATHLDILAHILSFNAFPAGEELEAAMLPNIRVEGRDGPGIIPPGSLVEVVGCLTPGADLTWNLTSATSLTRIREPGQPGPNALRTSETLGTQTYRLLSPESFTTGFRADAHRGHKMQARGLLVRTPTEIRINTTWLEKLAETCP
jgi:hypothetical protein